MNEKMYTILKISLIIVLMIFLLIFEVLPEYKKNKGSSDKYINTEEYESIVEIKVNNAPNFILIINQSKITNILFLDEKSICLYNQNIEGKNIFEGINEIVKILFNKKLFNQDTTMTLTKYNEKYYNELKTYLSNAIATNGLTVKYNETTKKLTERADELSLSATTEEESLKEIELYSKEIIRHHKNNFSSKDDDESNYIINTTTAKEYANTVYKKISTYAEKNQITEQDISSSVLPINLIPADSAGLIYPSNESWYYIKEKKVYAYIVIDDNNLKYKYCYLGAIEKIKEGECT